MFDLGFGFLTAFLAEVIHNNLQICLIGASIVVEVGVTSRPSLFT